MSTTEQNTATDRKISIEFSYVVTDGQTFLKFENGAEFKLKEHDPSQTRAKKGDGTPNLPVKPLSDDLRTRDVAEAIFQRAIKGRHFSPDGKKALKPDFPTLATQVLLEATNRKTKEVTVGIWAVRVDAKGLGKT